MENKEEIIKLKNITEAGLDGVKSFIITQLDEMVLPFIYKKMRSVFVVGLMGFLFSLSIETVQYITRRGLFEFDDLFNNTVGTVAGYIIFYIIQSILITFIDRKK